MSEFTGAEFTGERVIPELVDPDLFNEHLARYRFANHFASSLKEPPRVLDAGCGSGYGTAELSCAASVTATDISSDALDYARHHFARPEVRFLQGTCEGLPLAGASFDLITAFEVIEHLERWPEFLKEANRVLVPSGTLLVSTPNREYYKESRGTAGPNPFHQHEFDGEEFERSLKEVFAHVRIWAQNHAGAIVFAPQDPAAAFADAAGVTNPADSHFFLAACSQSPIIANEVFVWLPSSANILRERELHIAKLSEELGKKDVWLRQSIEAHGELQSSHEALTAELDRQNNWAAELNREIALRDDRYVQLEARYQALQTEHEQRLNWVGNLQAEITKAEREIDRLRLESEEQEKTLVERTLWAQRLDEEIASHCAVIAGNRAELHRIASSNWVRVGAKLGLGPRVRDGQ